MSHCRIGVDVGGTFTDFALLDSAAGAMTTWKEPSNPDAPAVAIGAGIARLLEIAGRRPEDVSLIAHGTTLALNAILSGTLARTGLVVSSGFGDILVIGRGDLPNPFNYKEPKRQPPIPRHHVHELPARLRPDGSISAQPTDDEMEQVALAVEAARMEALGILVINSYAHPALEQAIASWFSRRLPDVLVTASADLWPVVREYERALVTTLNGSIHRLMDGYYRELAEILRGTGVGAPIFLTASNGGMLSIDASRGRPIETLYSGPAGGVVAARRLGEACGIDQLVTFDMGGTSSDLALIVDGRVELANETRIGDSLLSIPVVDVRAIGAGGGSILWVDAQGVLKVGPRSAGATPGPIAFAKGGTEPTITDCYLALGLLDPALFLGGRMPLDVTAACAGLDAIASAIGIVGPYAAQRVAQAALKIATVRMATEIFKSMTQRGLDPAAFTLLAFGGAGPTHAAILGSEARLQRIVIPPSPGVFCAFGALLAPVRRDFARSRRVTLGIDHDAGKLIRQTIEELEQEARAWIAHEGATAGRPTIWVGADMQYPRTATESTVTLPEEIWRGADPSALAELFHRNHERLYTFRSSQSPIDVSTIRLTVSGEDPPFVMRRIDTASGKAEAKGVRRVFVESEFVDVPVYFAADLRAGHDMEGPALVELPDSTAWIAPGWRAKLDDTACLHLSTTATKDVA